MDNSPQEVDFSDYNHILTVFIELRGRGVTVSAQDLEVLQSWATDRLNPQSIADCLVAMSQDCQEKGTRFATTLKALDRHVRRAIRQREEY